MLFWMIGVYSLTLYKLQIAWDLGEILILYIQGL
jgi:hypothetical protein